MLTPMPFIAILSVFAALALISVKRIPDGHAYTLRRIGGHMRTIGAGIHVVLPLIERVAHKINLLGNVVEIAVQRPSGSVALRGRVYFQVMDAQRADAVIDGMADLLSRRIPELLDDGVQEDATACNLRLKAALNGDLRERGLLITRVQLAPA
jgi:regulator of protease activity HflC (stomatin/prohibitin superfamily)